MNMQNSLVEFSNTEVAFAHMSNAGLSKARLLFRSFNFPGLLTLGPPMASVAIALGFKNLIKNTIFEQFCGGEDIETCKKTIDRLAASRIGTILDYSVEGEESEDNFNATCAEILKTIVAAAGNSHIPFSVFKTTGIIRFALLEKMSKHASLSEQEKEEWQRGVDRFNKICSYAEEKQVRIFVDAEESWIQDAIDRLTEEAARRHNTKSAIVFNTIQLYRHDRLEYLKSQIVDATWFLGFKLVRGAYMEKERKRAVEMGYQDPIQPDKAASDRDYNEALKHCVHHIEKVSICAGTHNENSSRYLMELMEEKQLKRSDERIWFSQLLGMSDHISYNLSNAGYNVCKYVPYGPVKAVIPYLTRRASENSSVAGQMGRELSLIETEIKRRKIAGVKA
jgi:proline dehydrogenase